MRTNRAVGYQGLCELYNLRVTPHYRTSYISTHGRGYERHDGMFEIHVYPNTYAVKDFTNPFCHIEFALKYDGMNLEVLHAVFVRLATADIETYLQQHPTSKYSRIIWFLFEFLLDFTLNVVRNSNVKYVSVLDADRYFVAVGVKSKRHRVYNNLLGNKDFCPLVRKTKLLNTHINNEYDLQAKKLAEQYDSQTIDRASYYLYTKETLSSYKIEREQPNKDRLTRFIDVLQQLSIINNISKQQLIELQNIIVDPRFKDVAYRQSQNYVGEIINYQQRIHYISPKPENVGALMDGLLVTLAIAYESKIHAVIIAAIISFGFVFIHPFEDGNGRIHRLLIHYIIAKMKFTAEGIIFPVSAVMLQKIHEYDHILESFSKNILQLITDYDLSDDGKLIVKQDTQILYQYTDYTRFAEYLFACIAETLHEHFEKELNFLVKYDATKRQLQAIVDMPDRSLDLFIKFVCQNYGLLSQQKKEKYFAMLTADEIVSMQDIVKTNMLEQN